MKLNKLNDALVRGVKGTITGGVGRITLGNAGFWSDFLNFRNFSGKRVTPQSTLQLSAAWACIRLISQTISTLPVGFYKSVKGASVLAVDHPLYPILLHSPNQRMTVSMFWQMCLASALLWGASYVHVRRSTYIAPGKTRGAITSFDFLQPDALTYDIQRDGSVLWHYNDPIRKVMRDIPDSEMWFTPMFTLNGYDALSPISVGANVFGGAMAADEASANTFKNGMKSSGLVTMDSILNPKQRNEVRKHVKDVSQNGGVFVLEKGAGFQQLSMSPQDAQLLATREFNIAEICRWYGVDPSLIAHGGKDSNWGTGLEEKMTWFVTLCLRPLCKRFEDSARKHLLEPEERAKYSLKFGLEGLLRGDSKARAAFYSQMTQNGIFTRDYCRELEDLPPMGGNAEVLTVQSNMAVLDKLGETPAAVTPPADPDALTEDDVKEITRQAIADAQAR